MAQKSQRMILLQQFKNREVKLLIQMKSVSMCTGQEENKSYNVIWWINLICLFHRQEIYGAQSMKIYFSKLNLWEPFRTGPSNSDLTSHWSTLVSDLNNVFLEIWFNIPIKKLSR